MLTARAAVGDDLLGHPFGRLGIDIGDDNRGALTGQRLGVRLTDAATGTGDDGDFVLEPHVPLELPS